MLNTSNAPIKEVRFDREPLWYISRLLECSPIGLKFICSGRHSNLLLVLKRINMYKQYNFIVHFKDCQLEVRGGKILFDTTDINSYATNSFFRILIKNLNIEVDNC